MRRTAGGWRTLRSAQRVGAGSGYPAPVAEEPIAPLMPPTGAQPADLATGMPWQNVGWTLTLAGLLVYIWSVTTYSVPLAQPGMIVAILGLAIQGGAFRFPPFLWLFAAYLGWALVGASVTEYPAEVAKRIDLFWRVGLIALVVVNALDTRARQRMFMFAFLGAFALYPARGTLFNYFGGYRLFGRALWNYIYANPNDLAALTLLQLSMAMAIYVREPKGWPKLAAMAGMVLLPFIILLTQSRGAFLALAATALLLIAGQRKRARTLVIVATVGAVVAMAAPDSLWERIGGLRHVTDTEELREVDQEGSAEQRYEIWKVARKIIRENLVMGVGVGAYPQAHLRYSMGSEFKRTAMGTRDTHSTYLNVLAESGVVGLALFLGIFGSVAYRAERVRRRARNVLPSSAQQIFYLELGLLAFFLSGIFGSYAKLAFVYVHASLLWAVTDTIERELAARPSPARRVAAPAV